METREILWGIDPMIKKLMYICFFFALCIFFYGFYKIFKGFKKEQQKYNFKEFLNVIFFQGKLFRKPFIGFIHSCIYYSFFILWIATELVAIHYDTPFKVFQGATYLTISLLADISGVILVLGLLFAAKRRFIDKKLQSKKPELYMSVMLFTLVLLGFLLEALRIQALNYPSLDKTFSPIGYLFAQLLPYCFSPSFYQTVWTVHMLQTMFFIAFIPFSRFKHFFIAPTLALFENRQNSALLNPLNFEKEQFGYQSLSDLTSKEKLYFDACVECQRCTDVCPSQLASHVLNPKDIILKTMNTSWHEHQYAQEELDSCTTCGACMQECPVYIEHVPLILNLKRYKTMALGLIDPLMNATNEKIKASGNPWGYKQEERDAWATSLNIPIIEKNTTVEYLYYVGCAGSYEKKNQETVKSLTALMNKANVSYAILGKKEKCTGDPLRRSGDEYSFVEIATQNIVTLNEYSFHYIVTHCPHCLHTLKEYRDFGGNYKVIHHTELLSHLIDQKKLKPINDTVTYHDPCYLGRHHGAYDEPRNILGKNLLEPENNKDKSLCCGMGGGNMWKESPSIIPETRLKDLKSTGSNKIITSCSFCLINFSSHEQTLLVEDIATELLKYN